MTTLGHDMPPMRVEHPDGKLFPALQQAGTACVQAACAAAYPNLQARLQVSTPFNIWRRHTHEHGKWPTG
eukprot:1139515-Pelagomonas_calceolata.AAC.7